MNNLQCLIVAKPLLSYKFFLLSSENFPAMQNPTTGLNVSIIVPVSNAWFLSLTEDLLFYFYYCTIWEKSFLESITIEAFHCVIWEHNFFCAIRITFFCGKEDVTSLSKISFMLLYTELDQIFLDIVVRIEMISSILLKKLKNQIIR